MKLARFFFTIVSAIIFCVVLSNAASASVVTLEFANKSARSDVNTLEPKRVQVKESQIGVHIESTTSTPQQFALKVNGLSQEKYDVYVNGAYLGEKTAKELTEGIQLTTPGAVGDQAALKCAQVVRERIRAQAKHLHDVKGSEATRIGFTLDQADDWVGAAIAQDRAHRSTDVIIAPLGVALVQMSWGLRSDAEDTAEIITRACRLLQEARDRMYKNIKDPKLRNAAVAAMTPVDLYVTYNTTKQSKPHAEIKLLNNCNLPISGAFSMSLPKGWKSTAKGLSFAALGSGKTLDLSFDLIPSVKGAVPPSSLPVSASIKLFQDPYEAKMILFPTLPQAPSSAPAVPKGILGVTGPSSAK